MLSKEYVKLLVKAIAIVLSLHFAKDTMPGEYRNILAVVLVVHVLFAMNLLLSEDEGADTEEKCQKMLWFIPMETKTEGFMYNIMIAVVLVLCCASVIHQSM